MCIRDSCETCQAECFEDAEKTFEQYGDETCAFMIEPLVQAAAGMKIYSPVYLQKLRKACDKYHVHLIADEKMCIRDRYYPTTK